MQFIKDDKGSQTFIITKSEIKTIKTHIEEGLVQEINSLPFEGLEKLYLVGTEVSENGSGNLRAVLIPKEGEKIKNRDEIMEFVKQLGENIGLNGDIEKEIYDNVSVEQIDDAIKGKGKFPFRHGRHESE